MTDTTVATETTTTSNGAEPDFNQLSLELAAADLNARSASSDAGAAREARNATAVDAIKAAFSEKVDSTTVRETLLAAGVLKGTVSKIVQIVEGLTNRLIDPEHVNSLNGAYNKIKAVKAEIEAGKSKAAAKKEVFAEPIVAIKATSPAEAIKILTETVKSLTDPDEAYKLAGEFLTKVTNGLNRATKAVEKAASSEEE